MILESLTDEEFLHALDRADPMQARMESILLALPTSQELENEWIPAHEVAELSEAVEKLLEAIEVIDTAYGKAKKEKPKPIQQVVDQAARLNSLLP